MLMIKITSDLDVSDSRILKMEIKSEYNSDKNQLLRSMGFVWDRFNKNHTKIITNKTEAKQLIKHLAKSNKDYVFEFVKVMKRKRSASLNKSISNVFSNTVTSNNKLF